MQIYKIQSFRYENLRAEAKDIEASIKLGNDGLENLVRIQAK